MSAVARYAAQCAEWRQIAQELTQRDNTTVAFDVSEEQRRRMAARGESEVTLDELIAELGDSGG